MTLFQSAVGFAASIAVILYFSHADKKSGVDNHRLIISIVGILSMMCLFFLLVNLLVIFGVLK